MKYCQYCGAMLEDDAQCTCKESQQAMGFTGQQPGDFQQPGGFQQSGGYQQPGDFQQPGGYQQPGYYQQPGGYQQPGYYQQPGGPQQPGYYQQPPINQHWQMAEAQKKAKAAANGLGSYLNRYFASPAEAVRGLTQEGAMVSAILTVIRILSVCLAVYGVLHKICSITSAAINPSGGLLYGGTRLKITAPILGSLLYGALIAVVCMGLFVLGVFAVVKLQKGDLSLRGAWQASAGNSMLATALLLLSFLVSFLSLPIALALIGLSVVASIAFGALTAQFVHTGSKSGMFWLLFFLAVVVIAIITYYAVPALAMKAAGDIAVSYGGETETLGSAIKQVQEAFDSSGGFEEILNEIMRDILY